MGLIVLAATPRVGATAVLTSLQAAMPDVGEWPEGKRVSLVHWQDRPSAFPYRTRFVLMTRRDKLAQAISWYYSAQTGRYHAWQKSRRSVIRFDANAIREGLEAIHGQEEAWRQYLNGREELVLTYEDATPRENAHRLLDHFGIQGEAGEPTDEPFAGDTKRALRFLFQRGEAA